MDWADVDGTSAGSAFSVTTTSPAGAPSEGGSFGGNGGSFEGGSVGGGSFGGSASDA
jgi:hypothetical protein